MRLLSYLLPAPAPQLRANPGPGRGPRSQPCGLRFPNTLRAAAAAAAVSLSLSLSLSLISGNAVGSVFAASAAQPTEVCRNGGAAMVEEVRAESVTNEQLVEEAWGWSMRSSSRRRQPPVVARDVDANEVGGSPRYNQILC